jgi:hypothetical protein
MFRFPDRSTATAEILPLELAPLVEHIRNNRFEQAIEAIRALPNVNIEITETLTYSFDSSHCDIFEYSCYTMSLLHLAINSGHLGLVTLCVDKGADLSKPYKARSSNTTRSNHSGGYFSGSTHHDSDTTTEKEHTQLPTTIAKLKGIETILQLLVERGAVYDEAEVASYRPPLVPAAFAPYPLATQPRAAIEPDTKKLKPAPKKMEQYFKPVQPKNPEDPDVEEPDSNAKKNVK